MDRDELTNNLQAFKNACFEKGYIYDDITFNEAYPGVIPTSFIVNVVARKSWLYSSLSEALDKLIDVLWSTAEKKTRASIFALSIYTLDQLVDSENTGDRARAATNPDLTSEQIKKLFHDKKTKVWSAIRKHIEKGQLTDQQIQNLLETKDDGIIELLKNRCFSDDKFREFLRDNCKNKYEYLKQSA